jgi:ubiquinone biosynthesis protein Coq4
MEAITSGWRYGRIVRNLQFERWESILPEPLATVRARYDVAADVRGAT